VLGDNPIRRYELTTGEGRTKVSLLAYHMGDDLIVCIYNENAHIGAVAVGEYDHKEKRASCSVITRVGHRDDAVAQEAARSISRHIKQPVCIVAGIHLDKITAAEIDSILENARRLVAHLCAALG
jgi:hypothetical protein